MRMLVLEQSQKTGFVLPWWHHQCACCAGSLSDEQKACLLQTFKVLCVAGLQPEGKPRDGEDEARLIRCNCCYNLPVIQTTRKTCSILHYSIVSYSVTSLQAMVVFVDSAHFLSELYPSFSGLCGDPEVSVRRSAAASFHQVRPPWRFKTGFILREQESPCSWFLGQMKDTRLCVVVFFKREDDYLSWSHMIALPLPVRWQSCWAQTSTWCTRNFCCCCRTMLWRWEATPTYAAPPVSWHF